MSLRQLAAKSGWSKSAISKAQCGPGVPNPAIVEAVIRAGGGTEGEAERWRDRVDRLRTSRTAPAVAAAPSSSPTRFWSGRRRLALTIGLATVAGVGGLTGLAEVLVNRPAVPANVLGGIDVVRECSVEYGMPLMGAYPLDRGNPFTWECSAHASSVVVGHGVDMNRACRTQYGRPAHAVVVPPGDAYSWRCVPD